MESRESRSVRIRLCFEEDSMLSKVQADQGLAKSWYLVDTNALSRIANLATRIALDYNLGQSCPRGISLEMCGFVLPPSQSTRLLQGSDLVSVRRSQDGVSGGHSRGLLTNSLSVDNEELRISTRYNKVGLRALEEFEKEAGGYESEYSEDEDPKLNLGVGNNVESAETAKRMSKLTESNGKKRKRSSNIDTLQSKILVTSPGYPSRAARRDLEGSDVQNTKSIRKEKIKEGTECILVDGDGIIPLRSEKKKKKSKLVEMTLPNVKSSEDSEGRTSNAEEQRSSKKRTRKHKTDLEQVSLKHMEDEKTPCHSKRGENLSVLNGGTGITTEASHDRKKSKKRKDKNPVEVDGQEVQPKKKSDKINSNGGNAPAVTEQTDSDEKRPSRSARRKKAKRRWLREQAQNGTLPKQEDVKENRKTEPNAESLTLEVVAVEAEVEAEEEILPVMVAPGHIRFELDEDIGDEEQHGMPVLQLSANIQCKRQGQAWGQEKSYYDNHHRSSGYVRIHEKREKKHSEQLAEEMPAGDKFAIDVIQYEKLPVLNRVPRVGDVLAYKLVELTASWTPELSAYRVGKVSVYIGTTRVITLVPVPEYPIHVQQPEDYDMDAQQDDDYSFVPPYNPDGTLEVDLAALMEVRILEDGPESSAVAVQAQEAQKQELPNVGAYTENEGLLNSTKPVILQREMHQEDVEIAVAVQEPSLTSEDLSQNDHAGMRSGHQSVAEGTKSTLTIGLVEFLEPNCDTAWQDLLSQDLNKKKLELAAKFSQQLSGSEGAEPAGTPTTTSKQEALSNLDTKTGPGKKGIPQIRHRHMRTGALGPTMAMLRASQIL